MILNIFSNYCTSKTIIGNGKDHPWVTDRIKTVIEEKAHSTKVLNNKCKFTCNLLILCLVFLSQRTEEMKISNIEKYYNNLGSKLNNQRTHCRTYETGH